MTFSLFSRTVYETKSKISGEIVVKEQLGQYTLHVQGMLQSGGVIKGAWKKALNKIGNWHSEGIPRSGQLEIGNCLILGLGGGTVVQLIKAYWPKTKIIGIEIDPEIVRIGKKYFGLGEVRNLKTINADAIDWIEFCSNDLNHDNKKFDLVIVDLYLGDQFSPKAESEEFLKGIKKLLSKKGIVVFNQLKNKESEKLRQNLSTIFFQVESLDLKTNLFLICRP